MSVRSRLRKRRAPDVPARLESLRTALTAGRDRLDPEASAEAEAVLARTDERLAFGPDLTVVALAGATGSGKSSLFNALAGIEVATVGARRPTTSSPTAVVWGDDAPALLDWLDVPRRHRTSRESALDGSDQSDLFGLVLLDLPDHDSKAMSHRLEVDRLVGLVDLLVWVVDPQKYADEVLHERYLRRLSGHQAVTVVVLNQIDRLPDDDVLACVADLKRLLVEDGLHDVPVIPTSAVTGDGVDELRGAVVEAVRAREAVAIRSAADLDRAATRLRADVGDSEADPADVAGRDLLITALANAAGVPAVLDAVHADVRRQAAARLGWPFVRWVARLRPDPLKRLRIGPAPEGEDEALRRMTRTSLPEPTQAQRAQVELASRQVATRSSAGLPQRWADAIRVAAAPPGADLTDSLDRAVATVDLAYRRPLWWAVAGALQLLLAVAAVLGLLWLGVLGVVAWLQLPELVTPMLGPVPWPTLLLLGGLAAGLLIAVLGRPLAAAAARRRRRHVEGRLREAVAGVAHEHVLDPVAQVLTDHRTTREALAPQG